MTIGTKRMILAAALAAIVSAGRAAALEPRQVLVVGNKALADSAALAKFYAEKRGIDAKNVVLLETTGDAALSRADYEAKIRDPIRKAITERKLTETIRCICVVWGVPFRISEQAGAAPSAVPASLAAAAKKLHYRLVIDHKLLATVGQSFPKPRTAQLLPAALLFTSTVSAPPEPLMPIDKLREDIDRLLTLKQQEAARLTDAAQRQIAERQLMAMHLELRGPAGLIEYIRSHKPAGAPKIEDLQKQLDQAKRGLALLKADRKATVAKVLELTEQSSGLLATAAYAEKLSIPPKVSKHLTKNTAAVDSELALLWWKGYPLAGAGQNPMYWRSRSKLPPTLMTARIDGPSRADAMRIIKASLAVEAAGLDGVFYIDAGGPNRLPAAARNLYDQRFQNLHRFVTGRSKVKAVLDTQPAVFRANSCPHAALYVGWYSLRKYVPAFMWTPGAVGWHVASWEAVNLRDPATQEWCAKMIQNGVAATVGAVSEPLLNHFPGPEEFFPLLLTGKYTVAECYWRTVPATSWQMMLIADPLYNPFKTNPQVKASDLPPGLAP